MQDMLEVRGAAHTKPLLEPVTSMVSIGNLLIRNWQRANGDLPSGSLFFFLAFKVAFASRIAPSKPSLNFESSNVHGPLRSESCDLGTRSLPS